LRAQRPALDNRERIDVGAEGEESVCVCSRTDRPLTLEQVKERDKIEIATLRTAAVIAEADYTIINEYSMETFKNNLERFWEKMTDSTL
jgi:hypothetical protein